MNFLVHFVDPFAFQLQTWDFEQIEVLQLHVGYRLTKTTEKLFCMAAKW